MGIHLCPQQMTRLDDRDEEREELMTMYCSNRLMPLGSALSVMSSKLQQAIIPFCWKLSSAL